MILLALKTKQPGKLEGLGLSPVAKNVQVSLHRILYSASHYKRKLTYGQNKLFREIRRCREASNEESKKAVRDLFVVVPNCIRPQNKNRLTREISSKPFESEARREVFTVCHKK